MKSIKDALTLYRTLAAEALSEFSYSQRGEALGRHLDDAAWRLSMKVRPPRGPAPDYGIWQQVHGIDFASLISEVEAKEAPLVERSQRLQESYRPMFEQVAASLQHLDGMEWKSPVVPTQEAKEAFRASLNIQPFRAFDNANIEPWQMMLQDHVNDMVLRQAAIRGAYERDFLRDVEIETGFRLPLSGPPASVDDIPTT